MISLGNAIKGNSNALVRSVAENALAENSKSIVQKGTGAINSVSKVFNMANTFIRGIGLNGFNVLGTSGYRPSQWGSSSASNMVMIKSNIGGFFADAIFTCNVERALSITSHPVQSGANISDHALVQPASITMELGVSDAMASYSKSGYTLGALEDTLKNGINIDSVRASMQSNSFLQNAFCKRTVGGEAKSTKAIKLLEQMQASRTPMTVVTPRGESISNCLIENISWEESADSLYSIRIQLTLKQIFVAKVSTGKVSARNWVSGAGANKGEAGTVEEPQSKMSMILNDPAYNNPAKGGTAP